jgi:hypothetical protein
MKGKLINKQGKWIVQYLEAQDAKYMCSQMTTVLELPLHPTNIAGVELMWEPEEDVAYKNVEFKIDMCIGMSYAKLIQPSKSMYDLAAEQPDTEETKEETWDDIFALYFDPFTKDPSVVITPLKDWLKQNYFSPKKK